MINYNDNFFKSVSRTDKTSEVSSNSEDPLEVKSKKPVNPRKDFKDVLADEEEESKGAVSEKKESEDEEKTSLMSLFSSPPKSQRVKNPEIKDFATSELTLNPDHQKKEIAALNETIKEMPALKSNDTIAVKKQSSLEFEENKVDALSKKGKFNTEYVQEQPDLTFINPNTQLHQVNPINLAAAGKVEKTAPVASPIQDIVVELIDKLTIVQTKGQTDTVITLNIPGAFKGAIVVISEYDTAKGELNLAFENLTVQAKNLLDNMPNREALLVSLSEKGYTVQNLITTTIVEHRPIIQEQTETSFGKDKKEPEDESHPNKENQE